MVIDTLTLVFVVLLALDLALAAVRASLMNARLPYLLNLHDHHAGLAEQAVLILERPRLRTSLHAAMVLAHLTLAGSVLAILLRVPNLALSPAWIILIVLAVGILALVGEYFIQGIALRKAEEWTLHLAPYGRLVDVLLTPISTLLLVVARSTPLMHPNLVNQVTEDDLKTWVEIGQTQGGLEKEERQMIYSIFQFRDTLVREIMIPRMDVQVLGIITPLPEALEALSKSGHSRVPVYEETIDNIIGLLYAKDLLSVHEHDRPLADLRGMLRPTHFIPETKRVDELLTEMQSSRIHMAIVVDEYGGMAGLVTLEDIMEEIVGEIQDEYDQAEEMVYQQVGPDEYVFLGRIDLDDFNDVMGSHLAKESADKLAGYIFGQIGRIPAGGETLRADGVALTVEQVSGRRIRKVRARRIQTNTEVETEEEANADQ
jgi:CBS domain containing-hemolysin-like protein